MHLSRKRPSCRFMRYLCKNENIPMWGKHRCRITKEIAIHLSRIITLKPMHLQQSKAMQRPKVGM